MTLGEIVSPRVAIKDLFGKSLRQRRPRYEAALEKADKASLSRRGMRVRWLAQTIPRNILMAMPYETMCVFQEAKASFISGQFVATIVLAASFLEHWFASKLGSIGFDKEASQGLAASIDCARKNNLVPSVLLDKADRLRQIRNPFVHLKSFEHEHNISRRAFVMRQHPDQLLERDAQDSLTLMYGITLYAFK
jgi:hypothetical protein